MRHSLRLEVPLLPFDSRPWVLAVLATLPATADAARYTFDDSSAAIAFEMKATLHPIRGVVGNFSGELNIEDDAITGKLSITAKSLDTGLGLRDKRMWGYCLETARWASIDLVVNAVSGDEEGLRSGEGSGPIELVGQLTIRSSTREVNVPATYTWTDEGLRLVGRHAMQWADYGVPDPSIPLSRLLPDMTIVYDLKLGERPG